MSLFLILIVLTITSGFLALYNPIVTQGEWIRKYMWKLEMAIQAEDHIQQAELEALSPRKRLRYRLAYAAYVELLIFGSFIITLVVLLAGIISVSHAWLVVFLIGSLDMAFPVSLAYFARRNKLDTVCIGQVVGTVFATHGAVVTGYYFYLVITTMYTL